MCASFSHRTVETFRDYEVREGSEELKKAGIRREAYDSERKGDHAGRPLSRKNQMEKPKYDRVFHSPWLCLW
eukprot:scaffold166191_cov32-Prasinocladus_malaysianus.AAC.1